jgi:hypothetical protein
VNSVRTQLREIRSRLNELQKSIAIELSQIDKGKRRGCFASA